MNTLSYQNYKVELPADIEELVRRRRRKRIVRCAVWFCVTVAILIYSWFTMSNLVPKNYFIFGIVFLILPFVFTGVPFVLRDKSCCGEIVELSVKTETIFDKSARVRSAGFVNVVYARIQLEDGKIVRKIAYKEWVHAKQKRLDVLQIGDVVVYISGMHFVQRISDDERKDNFCVVCGALRPSKEEKCCNCGHTLNFKPMKEKVDPSLWWDTKSDAFQ